MGFIKCYAEKVDKWGRKCNIHLWDDEEGYNIYPFQKTAFKECPEQVAEYQGLNGEFLQETNQFKSADEGLHFHDMPPHQRFLISKYGIDDNVSINHKIVYFDIEIEIGGALTEEYIQKAPKPVTSIAWYYPQIEQWFILILDEKEQLKQSSKNNQVVFPCSSESQLLSLFLRFMQKTQPDILVGYNSDYFDLPYLYYRISKVLGKKEAEKMSPLGIIKTKKDEQFWMIKDTFIDIAGVESLDYMRLHRKYSWKDEPSYKLEAIGEKYAKIGKIDYEGTLDTLFRDDVDKFIEYNFRDVEILVKLEEKLNYLELTKNLAHKGKINYSEVYANSKVHDGAISAFLLSQNIIPPRRDKNPITKKGYAGGYLFCPKAGVFNYVFDEDLTSLYPSIIMSLNIGKETLVGRVLGKGDRDNRLGLNDLKKRDPKEQIIFEDPRQNQTTTTVGEILNKIISTKCTIAANGTIFRTDKKSVLSTILDKWFNERVYYKNEMKKAYKSGNSELGSTFHMKQYTMKILLNSLYGATALGKWRYGNVLLSEAITLSGQRIIQESALFVNTHMNKRVKC